MANAVFTTKLEPTYDDLPEFRYHFPATYLRAVEASLGDWIVYYEPRRATGDPSSRGGRSAYFAVARVTNVVPDPTRHDHFYAYVGDFLQFDRAVPFQEADLYYEGALRRADGKTNKGAFGRAVRMLSPREFAAIFEAGFSPILHPTRPDFQVEPERQLGFAEEQQAFDRPVVERLVARKFRDVAFAGAVKLAYADRCAISGLKIINGGGRAEVQAAHIRPVADNGPDSVRNGLALSGTFHWMFDRGLISVSDDHDVLVAEALVPADVRRLIHPSGRLLAPLQSDAKPHAVFLRYHRERIFKGG